MKQTRAGQAFNEGLLTPGQLTAIERAVDILNQALGADPKAISELMRVRVPVYTTTALRDHPTIQIGCESEMGSLRPLGLINGLFGADADSYGYICMVCKTWCGRDSDQVQANAFF